MSRLTAPALRRRSGMRRRGLRVGPLIPRRYLLLALGLLAAAGLISLIAILSPAPHPKAPALSGPTIPSLRVHPPPISPGALPHVPLPGGGPSLPNHTEPESEPEPEPERIIEQNERDIETHRVTVSEATVHHPHHARFDLSLLALAALTALSSSFVKRRRLVPDRLRSLVLPLALGGALTLAILSVHVWESPKPPELVSLHTVRFHPQLIPQGVETQRDGNIIHVIHRFRRNVPERKLLHVHVWTLEAAWRWLPLLLSAALASLLATDLVARLRKPSRGPPSASTLDTANHEPRRIQ